jgi:hypothetical protein
VETGESHIAVQIGGGGARVYREHLQWCVALLKLNSHHSHHCILCSLAGYVCQGMPIGTDL